GWCGGVMEVAAMVVPAVKVRQWGWWCWRLMWCAVCGGGSDEVVAVVVVVVVAVARDSDEEKGE
nr:hypothetical protein [Tanacetum cinerariifolium]